MPQLYLCGTTTKAATCTEAEQLRADAVLFGGEDMGPSAALADYAAALEACPFLKIAFICYGGARSLTAAGLYAELLSELFVDSNSTVVSVSGGTSGWYNAGRPTDKGDPEGSPKTC